MADPAVAGGDAKKGLRSLPTCHHPVWRRLHRRVRREPG